MKKTLLLLALAAVGCTSAPEVTLDGDSVFLETDDLDVQLSRVAPMDGTVMLFGGSHVALPNAIGTVLIAGLPTKKARAISRKYPDFHRCNSKGAPLAKKSIIDMQIVPADERALGTLRSALDDFEDSLRRGGDRVCVGLRGAKLKLDSIVVRQVGEDISDDYPISTFYLVESASAVDCREAMARS